MENVVKSIRLIIAGLVLVPMALAASCSLLGVGTVYAVKEAAGYDSPEARAAAIRERKRQELREHNEEMNREAAYSPSRGNSDYYGD